MTGFLKHITCAMLLAASLSASGNATAATPKYTYLKIGEGESAQAYAFKSKQACETARRPHDADWNRIMNRLKKQMGNRGTFAAAPRAKCLDSLPLGFVRPKTGEGA